MTHSRKPAGPRTPRGPVGRGLVTTAAAVAALATTTPAHAAGPLSGMCYVDRSGAQTLLVVAYAAVSPGDVATRITVECSVTGRDYGYTEQVAQTAAGAAVVAPGAGLPVRPDSFRICYHGDARLTDGTTVVLPERCYTGSPFG